MKREQRVGIFGGSFDPVHLGHIKLALSAKREYKLDKVIFVPAYKPPHKLKKKLLPGSLRMKMLSLALKRFPFFCADKYELNRRAVTYTYSTLGYFRKKYRGKSLFFIVGGDSLSEFGSWKNTEKILKNADLIVGRRKGIKARAPRAVKETVHFLKSGIPDISSTLIRENINKGAPVTGLPASVRAFILKRGLYKGAQA